MEWENSLVQIFTLPFLKRFYLFTFRERGREGAREGEKHQCARETSIGCHSHAASWGPDPQPRHVPWLRIGTGNLSVHRPALIPLSHTSQDYLPIFWSKIPITKFTINDITYIYHVMQPSLPISETFSLSTKGNPISIKQPLPLHPYVAPGNH